MRHRDKEFTRELNFICDVIPQVRSIANQGFEILSIKDTTPIPHNGCRQRKPRRL